MTGLSNFYLANGILVFCTLFRTMLMVGALMMLGSLTGCGSLAVVGAVETKTQDDKPNHRFRTPVYSDSQTALGSPLSTPITSLVYAGSGSHQPLLQRPYIKYVQFESFRDEVGVKVDVDLTNSFAPPSASVVSVTTDAHPKAPELDETVAALFELDGRYTIQLASVRKRDDLVAWIKSLSMTVDTSTSEGEVLILPWSTQDNKANKEWFFALWGAFQSYDLAEQAIANDFSRLPNPPLIRDLNQFRSDLCDSRQRQQSDFVRQSFDHFCDRGM